MENKKDLIWLPEELVKKLKSIEDNKGIEDAIVRYIEDSKLDFKVTIESLDEDVLLYRAKMIQARNCFKEAKEAELDANYKLWENYEDQIKTTRQYVDSAKEIVNGLSKEVKFLNDEISKLDVYRINSFLESLKKVQGFMESEKDITKLVIDFYKK